MYRFRSVENLIGDYQELEKQQIYCASLDELNDPLEGKMIYFWHGDRIVMENLFKHYLLCLDHVVFLAKLLKDDQGISKDDIPVYLSVDKLPTPKYKQRIHQIYNQFFSDEFIQGYIDFMLQDNAKIYEEEMHVHLKLLHMRAIDAIFNVNAQYGLMQDYKYEKVSINSEFIKLKEKINTKTYNKMMSVINDVLKQMDSTYLLKFKDSIKYQSIYIEFSYMYIEAIKKLTYPNVYVACFMDNCLNSSIWGTYGNNHTGVCLKFKVDNLEPQLDLKCKTAWDSSVGDIYEYERFNLQPIEYVAEFEEVDFFRKLGILSMKQLKEQWYANDNGELSICSNHLFTEGDTWREDYWSIYPKVYLRKLPDWAHEREYRIVLLSNLGFYKDTKDRLLEYKFEDLEEIIFGMKTSREARIKIIEIVEKKCKESKREKFDFYEMMYSSENNQLCKRLVYSINNKLL